MGPPGHSPQDRPGGTPWTPDMADVTLIWGAAFDKPPTQTTNQQVNHEPSTHQTIHQSTHLPQAHWRICAAAHLDLRPNGPHGKGIPAPGGGSHPFAPTGCGFLIPHPGWEGDGGGYTSKLAWALVARPLSSQGPPESRPNQRGMGWGEMGEKGGHGRQAPGSTHVWLVSTMEHGGTNSPNSRKRAPQRRRVQGPHPTFQILIRQLIGGAFCVNDLEQNDTIATVKAKIQALKPIPGLSNGKEMDDTGAVAIGLGIRQKLRCWLKLAGQTLDAQPSASASSCFSRARLFQGMLWMRTFS